MILSQTSLSGAFPVSGALAPAGPPDGGKAAGGFLDGLLACLCEEGAVSDSAPRPVQAPQSAAPLALAGPEPLARPKPLAMALSDPLPLPAPSDSASEGAVASALLPVEIPAQGQSTPAIPADGVAVTEPVDLVSGDALTVTASTADGLSAAERSDESPVVTEAEVFALPPQIVQDVPKQADSPEPTPTAPPATGSEHELDGKEAEPVAEARTMRSENPASATLPMIGLPAAPASTDRTTQSRSELMPAAGKPASAPRVGAPLAASSAPAETASAVVSRNGEKAVAASAQIPPNPLPDGAVPTSPAPVPTPDGIIRSGAGATPAMAAPTTPAPVVMTQNADWPQNVVSATLATLTPEGGTMVLELAPDELGALQITLTLEGDTASVSIQTETAEAARVLNESERQLAQEFARHGVTLSAHDAQAGRRGDGRPHVPAQTGTPTEDPSPSDSAAPLLARGILNLIA